MTLEQFRTQDFKMLMSLLTSYKRDIGEEPPSPSQNQALLEAISRDDIRFFVVKEENDIIAMCSVCRTFSTYQCAASAVFGDFYIKPQYRNHGIARHLVNYVLEYCEKSNISSLTLACAESDQKMYEALGFEMELGKLLSWNKEREQSDI